jgi:hypothetical protein
MAEGQRDLQLAGLELHPSDDKNGNCTIAANILLRQLHPEQDVDS